MAVFSGSKQVQEQLSTTGNANEGHDTETCRRASERREEFHFDRYLVTLLENARELKPLNRGSTDGYQFLVLSSCVSSHLTLF